MQPMGAMLWVIPDVELLPQPPRRPSRNERGNGRTGLRAMWATLRREIEAGADETDEFLPNLRGYPY